MDHLILRFFTYNNYKLVIYGLLLSTVTVLSFRRVSSSGIVNGHNMRKPHLTEIPSQIH